MGGKSLITEEVVQATANTFCDEDRKKALDNLRGLELKDERLEDLREAFSLSQAGKTVEAHAKFSQLAEQARLDGRLGDNIHLSVKALCSQAPEIYHANGGVWDDYRHTEYRELVGLALGKAFATDEDAMKAIEQARPGDLAKGVLPITFTHASLAFLNSYIKKSSPEKASALKALLENFSPDYARGWLVLAHMQDELGNKPARNEALGEIGKRFKNVSSLLLIVDNVLEKEEFPQKQEPNEVGHPGYMDAGTYKARPEYKP